MKAFLINKTSERRIPLQTGAYADTYVEFNLKDVEVNDLIDIEKAVETDTGNLYVWNENPELRENGIVVLCDSKRDIKQKLPSVLMIGRNSGKIINSIRGNILLIGYDSTALKMVSLTSEQKQVIGRVFKPGRYHKEYRYIDGYSIVMDEEDEEEES